MVAYVCIPGVLGGDLGVPGLLPLGVLTFLLLGVLPPVCTYKATGRCEGRTYVSVNQTTMYRQKVVLMNDLTHEMNV